MTQQEQLHLTSGQAILEKYGAIQRTSAAAVATAPAAPLKASALSSSLTNSKDVRVQPNDWLSMLDDTFFDSSDSDTDSSSDEEDDEDMEPEEEDEALDEDDDINSQASKESNAQQSVSGFSVASVTQSVSQSISNLSGVILGLGRSLSQSSGLDAGDDDSHGNADSVASGMTDLILDRNGEEQTVDVADAHDWDSCMDSLYTLEDETIYTTRSTPEIIFEGLPMMKAKEFNLEGAMAQLNERAVELGLKQEDVMLLVDRLIAEKENLAGLGAGEATGEPAPEVVTPIAASRDIKVYRSSRRDRSGRRERSSGGSKRKSRSRSRSGRSMGNGSRRGIRARSRSRGDSFRSRELVIKEADDERSEPSMVSDKKPPVWEAAPIAVESSGSSDDAGDDEIGWEPEPPKVPQEATATQEHEYEQPTVQLEHKEQLEVAAPQVDAFANALMPPKADAFANALMPPKADAFANALMPPKPRRTLPARSRSRSQQQQDELAASFFQGQPMMPPVTPRKSKSGLGKLMGNLKKVFGCLPAAAGVPSANSKSRFDPKSSDATVTSQTYWSEDGSSVPGSRTGDAVSVSSTPKLAMVPEMAKELSE